jgi:uncharacterized protein
MVDAGPAVAGGAGMTGYWPWWAGAIALGAITVGYTWWTGRSLGVSAAWERVVHWRAERRIERAEAAFADRSVLLAALVAATQEEFGTRSGPAAGAAVGARPGSVSTLTRSDSATESSTGPGGRAGSPDEVASRQPLPVLCSAVLLGSVFVGGLLAAITSGRFRLRLDMGPGFSQIVTDNRAAMVGVLFLGGVLVGFGTRLAGGCSSGHGLSGCSRLQPASILATAVFFGTAVLVSVLLWRTM